MTTRSREQRHVVIAGGGFAAAEALLAVRALAHERVSLELVSADPLLRYRPAATGAPFGEGEVAVFDLAELAAGAGAAFRRDTLTAVMASDHAIRLASGTTRRYDALVLALGARRRAAIPGALTFRDQRDVHHVRAVLDLLRRGEIRRIVFTAPLGVAWTLPLYELALLTGGVVREEGLDASLTLVTPERRPLEVFGPAAGRAVAEQLLDHGVQLVCDARPSAATRRGLELRFDGTIPADRVIAVPRLVGPELPGVPADWNGFVPVDDTGRVAGLDDVYAAGDLADFPVKQGGLATQQADAVAAAVAGVPVPAPGRVLRARLAGTGEPLYLRAELDAHGRPREDGCALADELPWWPAGKVVGRHLSARLAQLEPVCAAA